MKRAATPALAREFLYQLSDRHASWSWTATHITALRTVFDKLGGASLTEGMVTPKRPRRLHDVLEPHEVGRLLEAAGPTRDRLAILLLYGCGLKTSELCELRWSDVDIAGRTVQVRFAGGTRSRKVLLPANAIPLLQAESCYRQGTDPVFAGLSRRKPAQADQSDASSSVGPHGVRSGSRHTPSHTVAPYSPGSLFLPPVGPHGVRSGSRPVSTRTVERIVRNAAVAAGLTDKEVNCRTLRRSYAVQCLRDGMDVETLRDSLGHKHVDSTLAYCRYRTPNRATLWFVGLVPRIGECRAGGGGAVRQVPLPCTAFPPALGTIQCSAP